MPRAKRRRVRVAYNMFLLSPENAPRLDNWALGEIMDVSGPSIVGRTGCKYGVVWVTVRALRSAPEDLADALASGGWELGEEEELDIQGPLALHGFMPDWRDVYPEEFVPLRPGRHRVRMLAKGPRTDDPYPAEGEVILEEYLIQIWPVDD